jgi:hypothetical protein
VLAENGFTATEISALRAASATGRRSTRGALRIGVRAYR